MRYAKGTELWCRVVFTSTKRWRGEEGGLGWVRLVEGVADGWGLGR